MTGDLIQRLEEEAAEIEATRHRGGGGSVRGCGDLITRLEEENAAIEAAEGAPPPMTGLAFDMGKLAARYEARKVLASQCESPIEIALGVDIVVDLAAILLEHEIDLRPQYRWQRWRMDFAMVKGGEPVLFIECDGREYHSTPQQLANDKRKDDAAGAAGIPLIRFSGTEIYKYADGCVHRVLEHLIRVGAV